LVRAIRSSYPYNNSWLVYHKRPASICTLFDEGITPLFRQLKVGIEQTRYVCIEREVGGGDDGVCNLGL